MKRIVCFMILFAILTAVLVSCASQDNTPADTTVASDASETNPQSDTDTQRQTDETGSEETTTPEEDEKPVDDGTFDSWTKLY